MAKRGRIDLGRVATTALETALNGEQPAQHRRFTGVKALAAGAALAAAARVAVRKAPSLPGLPDVSGLTDRIRERLAEEGWIEHEDFADDDEDPMDDDAEAEADPDDDFDEDESDDGDEEESEDDEPPPDDSGDQTEIEDDSDDDDSDDEEDEGSPGLEVRANGAGQSPDLMEILNEPPEPPRRKGPEKSSGSKTKAGRS
ncbi:MAG TPA: hypothetical protein VGF74_11660 [Thermoleophilaceae bacterium]